MNPKPYPLTNGIDSGSLFRQEARMILGQVLFWAAAMALIACPVWIPLIIEYFLHW